MEKEYESIGENTGLEELIVEAQESTYLHFVVLNNKKELVGILSMGDLKNCLSDDVLDFSLLMGKHIQLMPYLIEKEILTKRRACLISQ